jgi:hypothetical protein
MTEKYKCPACGEDLSNYDLEAAQDHISEHMDDKNAIENRLPLATKCPLCGESTDTANKFEAFCKKCFAYFPVEPLSTKELREKSKMKREHAYCFLCGKQTEESCNTPYFAYVKRSGQFGEISEDGDVGKYHAHDEGSGRYGDVAHCAHERCNALVADPILKTLDNEITKKRGGEEKWQNRDIKRFEREELRFLELVRLINHKTPIRKIAEQLEIDRGKVWRTAQRMKQAQSTKK